MHSISVPPAWSAERARAWARATSPWVLPFVVLAGAVVGCVFGIIGEGTAPCDPAHPAACGPDMGFSVALVLLAGSVVLQWSHPLLACGLGVAFAVLDIRYDTPVAARAFSAFLVVCLGVAGWVSVSRRRQLNLVRDAGGSPGRFSPSGLEQREGRWRWLDVFDLFPVDAESLRALVGYRSTRLFFALLFVAAAIGSGLAYQHAVDAEQDHLSRAVRVDARVSDGPDDAQTFTPLSSVAGGPKSVQLVPLEWYPDGSIQPLQLDPADPDWARLVAEPDDQTWWATLSGLAVLIALVLAGRELSVRRASLFLSSSTHSALSARVAQLPDGEVLILPTDRDVVVASMRTHPQPMDTPDPSWEPQIRDAVVYGDLRHLGWVAVQTDQGLALPQSPLKAMRNPAPFDRSWQDDLDGEDVDLDAVGDEVRVGRDATTGLLPITDGPPRWLRIVGAAIVVGVAVVGPYAAWSWTERFTDLWPVLVLGGGALERGVAWWAGGLLITAQGARVDSGFFRRVLPFAAVDRVRLDGETVVLVADQDALTFEPCPDVFPRSVRLERVREVAEVVRGLVDQASGGGTTPTRRLGLGAVAVAVFVVGVVGAGAARHLF